MKYDGWTRVGAFAGENPVSIENPLDYLADLDKDADGPFDVEWWKEELEKSYKNQTGIATEGTFLLMPPELSDKDKPKKIVTIVTMYRGHDAETFVHVVDGKLTDEQEDAWRKAFFCDEHYKGDPDDVNNMGFSHTTILPNSEVAEVMSNCDI